MFASVVYVDVYAVKDVLPKSLHNAAGFGLEL
jgi:hypothetical protein